jgi:saxitoxin biosynthesis operon SxtJ-like protein
VKQKSFLSRVLQGDATREQAKDTGMAIVLVCLLLAFARKKFGWVDLAILVHVVNMIAPQVFRPLAVVWFGFSHVLGNIVSRVVMGLIFFLVVTPIGVLRRLSGADSLQLKPFKDGRGSVMEERNHTYTGKDIEKPY